MPALEVGKKYMFNASTAKKNLIEDLYSSIVKYYQAFPNTDVVKLTGEFKPAPHFVMWVENDPVEVVSEDGMGNKRRVMVQRVRVCRPFSTDRYDMSEFIFEYPGPLTFMVKAMPEDGQKRFEDLFITSVVSEVINDLW